VITRTTPFQSVQHYALFRALVAILSVTSTSLFANHPPSSEALTCVPWIDAYAERDDLKIGVLNVNAGDLFNPARQAESRTVHKVANALHVATRESTIRHALTIDGGDPFSLRALAEAERTLSVDVDVQTVDNWTLTPSISFGSAGGVSRYGVELQDLNLLGLGKEVTFRLKESGEERSTLFEYTDDNVLGGRHRLALQFGDAEDGEIYGIAGGLPFYSSSTPLSWWVSARFENKAFDFSSAETETGNNSQSVTDVESTHLDALLARQWDGGDGRSRQQRIGLRLERQETLLSEERLTEANDFEAIYPYIAQSWKKSRWSKRKNYQRLGRTEDVDLGAGLSIEAGPILQALGSDTDALRISLQSDRSWLTSHDRFHRIQLGITQYIGGRNSRHEQSLRYQYFRWLSKTNQFDVQLIAERHVGQSPANALQLGGEYGLKGYPNAYARGGSRVIGLAEIRHVTSWSPFELTRAAFTAFAEVGRIGLPDFAGTGGLRSDETLADIGIGLVLAPSRSSKGSVFRFDIAAPLVGGEDIDDFQIFAGTQIRY